MVEGDILDIDELGGYTEVDVADSSDAPDKLLTQGTAAVKSLEQGLQRSVTSEIVSRVLEDTTIQTQVIKNIMRSHPDASLATEAGLALVANELKAKLEAAFAEKKTAAPSIEVVYLEASVDNPTADLMPVLQDKDPNNMVLVMTGAGFGVGQSINAISQVSDAANSEGWIVAVPPHTEPLTSEVSSRNLLLAMQRTMFLVKT